jgi:hypothetical protein
MKINRNVEAIIVTLLYLTCLYFWTLPIQTNPMPYGEVDAASHYSVADYTYKSDRSITTLPYYIDKRYGNDNEYKNHYLWYPPPFHTTLAIAAVFGGDTIVPVHIANAILSSLIVLGVYFLIRKLFGFEAALVSSFFLIFSIRDIMIYLWGQWPERMGFAYLPLVLYCFYKYSSSYLSDGEKPIYLYIMSLLLAFNFFIHPMDFFLTVMVLIIIGLFLLIKEKKLFFNIKHIFIMIILFLLIISIFPLQTGSVIVKLSGADSSTNRDKGDISRLFYWFKMPRDNPGVPQSYFSYKEMVGPYWTIPFIFLGLLFLLLRRNRKDLVMLGWFVGLYIMIHLDFIGMDRVHRLLSGSTHLFYPLIVLGLIYTASTISKVVGYKRIIRYSLIIVLVVSMLISVGVTANTSLKGAYSSVLRVNPYQYELTQWLKQNTPEDAHIYHMGSISLSKTRWMWMIGNRYMISSERENINDFNITHLVMDYSDFALVGDQNTLNTLQGWEMQNLVNNTLLYNKNNIRVYEFESQAE